MNTLRFTWLFSLALSLSLTGLFISDQLCLVEIRGAIAAASSLTRSTAGSANTVTRLQPERLKKSLDRDDITDAVKQIEQGWKQQYEDYFGGKFTTQLLSVNEISQKLKQINALTGKKTALIYAIPTTTQLELILVLPKGAPLHRRITAANKTRLHEVVQTFRSGVASPLSKPAAYLPAAQQLYQWLIAPLESALQAQQINTLIFCVGTDLRSLPIAALHNGKYFLTETYNLALIPAFNLLDRQLGNLQKAKILAMGASTFQEQPSLPAVPFELSVIASSASQEESWLNQSFTLTKLKARHAAFPFNIIHLATHAEFLQGSAEESYIQFWDRRLHLNQIQELGFYSQPVQLFVLSACRTALGDPQAELGFAGLAVMAGSKAAIASLWSVSDVGTLVLMAEFYHQLKTAPIKSEALRQAQLAMLKQKVNLESSFGSLSREVKRSIPPELAEFEGADLSHPYYWAAFTLIGNPW